MIEIHQQLLSFLSSIISIIVKLISLMHREITRDVLWQFLFTNYWCSIEITMCVSAL